MEREEIKEAIYQWIAGDMSRFASDIVFDIAGEVGIYARLDEWARENISESEIRKMVDEIMKDHRLRKEWEVVYKDCMKYTKDHKYCTRIASSTVVREYLSSEEVTKKLLDWVGRYLKEKILPLIAISVETKKKLISETKAL